MLFFLAIGSVRAQVATGTPPFGSFSGGPDTVNNANLNVHLEIPVVRKAGRGFPFTYVLSLDSSTWYPSSGVWTPVANWGWRAITEVGTGYVSYSVTQTSCYDSIDKIHIDYDKYTNWNYHDSFGAVHGFPGEIYFQPCLNVEVDTVTGKMAVDDSGYKPTSLSTDGGVTNATILDPGGRTFSVPEQSGTGAASITDPNGNTMSVSGGGVFIDTLNTTALTVSAPAPPASATYTYTGPIGPATFTVKYSNFNIKTNFGCSGITEYSPSTVPLVTEIDLPDTTKYLFSYEGTPGNSGYYTGRVASITLPTGGVITYAYTGGNNGIMCADGSAAGLTRTVNDNNGNVDPWIYSRSGTAPNTTTLIEDPALKTTTVNFCGIYETSRTFPGSLGSSATAYNNTCGSSGLPLPITQRTVTTTLGGVTSKVVANYNSNGLPTETDEYDYGTAPNPGGLLRTSTISYTGCGVTNSNVVDRPCTVQIKDGGGALASETDNTYDANGNLLTETHVNTTGSPASISRHFTYSSTGVLQTATDFIGNSTNFAASGYTCNNAFPNGVSPPIIPATNLTWDCNGALVTKAVDANSQSTSFNYDSTWRPTSTLFADSGSLNADFEFLGSRPPYILTSTQVTAGVYHQATTTLDGLGRAIHSSDNATGANVDTTYNALGRVLCVSNPYTGSYSGAACGQSGFVGSTYGYDALGRLTGVTYADGNAASVSYAGNCATSTDSSSKSRKSCADGLGRTTSVVEDPGGLNYSTAYTYNSLDNLIGVNQGGQIRTYAYDMLSRLISATTPESGLTRFTYDANGNVKTRLDARNITTTYSYDALNRLTTKSYSDGTPAVTLWYDGASATFNNWTVTGLTNTQGRLYAIDTSPTAGSPAAITGSIFSYDAVGRVNKYYQCMPANCGLASGGNWANSTYSYDLAGDLTSEFSPAEFTFTNTVSTGQQVMLQQSSYVGPNYPQNLGAFTYTAFGALATITDGCTPAGSCTSAVETYTYNNRLQPVRVQLSSPGVSNCRVYNYYSSVGNATSCTTPAQGTGNNGNVMGYYYSDPNLGHSNVFSYDSLNRLHTVVATGGSPANYNWTYNYDAYGNMQCSGSTGGLDTCASMTYNASTNRLASIGSQTPAYDGAGHMTSDGTGVGSHSYTWDAEGHMTSIASPSGGSVIATYQYNALGQRVQASGSGIGQYPVFQAYDAFGNLAYHGDLTTWGYAPFPPVNGKVYGKYYGPPLFMHGDALGSTGTTTRPDGTWAGSEIYDPWGQRWGKAGTLLDERFASIDIQRDPESGLDQTSYRMLNSTYGRWMSPDPLGGDVTNPQSFNRYAYVMNNPTTLTDPLGLCGQATEGYVDQHGVFQVVGYLPCENNSGGGRAGTGASDAYGTKFKCTDGTHGMDCVADSRGTRSGTQGGIAQRLNCAAGFADSVSPAALLKGFSKPTDFAADAVLGNVFSGGTQLGMIVFGSNTPTGSQAVTTLAGGAGQGLPVPSPGGKGAAGIAFDAGAAAYFKGITGANGGLITGITGAAAKASEYVPEALSITGATTKLATEASAEGAESFVGGVGAVKFGYDFLTFAYGVFSGCHP